MFINRFYYLQEIGLSSQGKHFPCSTSYTIKLNGYFIDHYALIIIRILAINPILDLLLIELRNVDDHDWGLKTSDFQVKRTTKLNISFKIIFGIQ